MKKVLLMALLQIVLIWPMVQFNLTRTFDIDPWEHFGWAMYAAPQRSTEIGVIALRNEALTPLVPMTPEVDAVFDRTTYRRLRIGQVETGDELAQAVLATNPDADIAVVKITEIRLDRATARWVQTETLYRHAR